MKYVLLPVLCLFVNLLPAATLEMTGESFAPMIYAHRNGRGRVLEMSDSSEILSRERRSAGFALLASDREGDREVGLTLKLVWPDGSESAVGEFPPLRLRKDRMLVRQFRLTLDDADLEKLASCDGTYNLLLLRLEAEFAGPDGKPLPALNGTAAVGFDRGMRPGFPKAEVVRRNGVPTLSVNGVFHPGIFGYVGWNWLTARQSIRDFGKAGFHLYEIVFQPWSLWKNGKLDVGELERKLNSQIVSVAAQDPEAMFFLRYWLYVPRDWSKFHPGEVIRYDDGSSEIPLLGGPWAHASYASVLWREEYKRMLRELIARLEKGPYADRVFMVRAGYGNCGEWNGFGYHQNKFPDYSPQMQAAYRMWLKRRYGTLDELNRSWKSSFADWSLIDIPSRAERLAGEGTLLRTSSGSGNCGDYYRFFSDYTVELIGDFGRTVKEASGGKLLFGVFYGYFLHHLTGVPYHSLDSGHYAMGKLLRLPEVDTVCSPYNYHRRERAISIGMPLESIKHHGKLFLAEMDLPTHLADAEKYHGTAGESFSCDRAEADTMTLYRRDFGRVLTWGAGGYWYDFAHGWYEFDAFRKFITDAARTGRAAVNGDMRSIAEVAVILDEESVFSISLHSGEWAKQLRETLGCTLESAGAPVDFWLASDLGAAVKRGYRLLVFANRFRADPETDRILAGFRGTLLLLGPEEALPEHACPPGRCLHAPAGLSAGAVRGVLDKAGVHRYGGAENFFVYANASYLGIWQPEGSREACVVTLPAPARLTDAGSGEAVSLNGRSFRLPPSERPRFRLYRVENQ